MEMIKGLNVAVQKLPARQKTGWWSRALTGTAWYAGKTIGKVLNWLGNLIALRFFSKEKSRNSPRALVLMDYNKKSLLRSGGY